MFWSGASWSLGAHGSKVFHFMDKETEIQIREGTHQQGVDQRSLLLPFLSCPDPTINELDKTSSNGFRIDELQLPSRAGSQAYQLLSPLPIIFPGPAKCCEFCYPGRRQHQGLSAAVTSLGQAFPSSRHTFEPLHLLGYLLKECILIVNTS